MDYATEVFQGFPPVRVPLNLLAKYQLGPLLRDVCHLYLLYDCSCSHIGLLYGVRLRNLPQK